MPVVINSRSYPGNQRAPIAESLRPGLSQLDVAALMAPLGLTLPVEARTWWEWHDGTHLQSIPTSHADLRLTQFVPADETTAATLHSCPAFNS